MHTTHTHTHTHAHTRTHTHTHAHTQEEVLLNIENIELKLGRGAERQGKDVGEGKSPCLFVMFLQVHQHHGRETNWKHSLLKPFFQR